MLMLLRMKVNKYYWLEKKLNQSWTSIIFFRSIQMVNPKFVNSTKIHIGSFQNNIWVQISCLLTMHPKKLHIEVYLLNTTSKSDNNEGWVTPCQVSEHYWKRVACQPSVHSLPDLTLDGSTILTVISYRGLGQYQTKQNKTHTQLLYNM